MATHPSLTGTQRLTALRLIESTLRREEHPKLRACGLTEGIAQAMANEGLVEFWLTDEGGCPIGDAVIPTGGNLKARHVIHAVGPVWRNGDEDESKLLASAYRRSLEVVVQSGLHSISFPSISTRAFGYPIRLAAPVALRASSISCERSGTNWEKCAWFCIHVRMTRLTRFMVCSGAGRTAGCRAGREHLTSCCLAPEGKFNEHYDPIVISEAPSQAYQCED